MKRLSIGGALVLLLFVHADIAAAQSPPASIVYQLNPQSAYEHGCFPPCYCALSEAAVQGTFALTPTGSGPLFQTFAVTDLNWTIQQSTGQLLVTGSGTYEIGGEVAAQQRLELDLQVGNQPVQHFDSGLVIAEALFPDISVTISVNGMMRCFDTVFALNASPATASDIRPYRLMSGSTLQRGCFPPCACAAGPREPLNGSFGLMPLSPIAQFERFAVVDANWRASPLNHGMPVSMHGFGLYQVGTGRMAGKQRLTLEMTSSVGVSTQFDSGLVPIGASFPLIAARVPSTGSRCTGTVITVHASP